MHWRTNEKWKPGSLIKDFLGEMFKLFSWVPWSLVISTERFVFLFFWHFFCLSLGSECSITLSHSLTLSPQFSLPSWSSSIWIKIQDGLTLLKLCIQTDFGPQESSSSLSKLCPAFCCLARRQPAPRVIFHPRHSSISTRGHFEVTCLLPPVNISPSRWHFHSTRS